MPKNLNLWGKYLRLAGRGACRGFKKWQVIPPIPVKAYGRVPSAASQTGLYHDEDFTYHTKRTFSMRRTRRKLKVPLSSSCCVFLAKPPCIHTCPWSALSV